MPQKFLSLAFVGALSFSALGFAACGGDDGGSDESYVREMCNAMNDFQSDMSEALTDIDPDASEEEMMETLTAAFRDLANSLEDANPPSDIQDAHQDMVQSMQDAADSLEQGDVNALNNMGDVEVAPEIEERLNEASENVEECEGLFNGGTGE